MGGKLSGNRGRKPWVKEVCLCPELFSAMGLCYGTLGLGEAYANLLALTEGYHALGFLPDEPYERLRARYTVPLDVRVRENSEKNLGQKAKKHRVVSMEPVAPSSKTDEELLRVMSGNPEKLLSQWPRLSPGSRARYVKVAMKNPEAPGAKQVLELQPKP